MAETAFDVKSHWSAMLSLGQAVIALNEASDLVLMAHGSTMAASSVYLLYEAADGLFKEMGSQLVAMKDSTDPEIREFVVEILRRLHGDAVFAPKSTEKHGGQRSA